MMGGGYFANAGVFLLNIVFGFYICAVMLRLILQLVRADFYNPLSQAVVKLTNPPLRQLRRHIPAMGRIDTASIVLVLLLQLLNTWLITILFGHGGGLLGLLLFAVSELLAKLVYLYIFALVVQAVASWIAPGAYNPLLGLIDAVTTPLLRPLRRHVPNLAGLDLSPMVAIILLQLTMMLVIAPMQDFASVLL